MELLVVVLNRVELLNDLLSVLVEAGITRATVFDSEGMGHHLAYEVPIFAGLRKMLGEAGAHNKTIFALIDDKKLVGQLKKLLKEVNIDFTRPGNGIMFTLPVGNVVKSEEDSLET